MKKIRGNVSLKQKAKRKEKLKDRGKTLDRQGKQDSGNFFIWL